MSLNNFIPALWSDRILQALETSLVYGQAGIINRDYEGQIQQAGDTVRINMIGDPTVGNYTKDTDISSPEALTSAQSSLLITEQKYVNFQVDNVDKAQQMPKVMTEAMRRSAYVLSLTTDKFLAAKYTDIDSSNFIGTDGTPKTVGTASSDSNAYNLLVDLSVQLDVNNVPLEGRWVVVPAWYYGLLLKDTRYTSANPSADTVKANGYVGKDVSGMMILKSNNVPFTAGSPNTLYKIIAGHSFAWTYAEQINNVVAYTPEKRFADAIKALHLYGAKILRPSQMALLTANMGTL